MFHRKRATSNPPRIVKSPPSQAASLAATQAFLANRASNGDLSAAAAAAALRSQTTSPMPVGQVQTKRMQRRESQSSHGSAPERPGLLRRTSSGSMTERTFRDPSPSRPASSHGPYPRQDEAPPVPALPKNIPETPQSISAQQRAARRAASVEPPERIKSPPPGAGRGRGVSLDRRPESFVPNESTSKAKGSNAGKAGEFERPGSRNSVNFSRPMSPQNSPPHSPLAGGRVKSPPPSKSAGSASLPNGEGGQMLSSIQEAAPKPVKKKKKAVTKDSSEDSQSTNDPSATPAASGEIKIPQSAPVQSTSSMPATVTPNTVNGSSVTGQLPKAKKKKKKAGSATEIGRYEAEEGFGNAYLSDTDSVISERSSTNERPRSYNTRAAGLLMKQPSIVREDREAEEQEEKGLPPRKMNGKVKDTGNATTTTSANTSKVVSKGAQQSRAVTQTSTPQATPSTSLAVPNPARPQSLSPARSTHFSSQPEYETADGVKHQPPARSVSPAKSALKHSPSRGSSPIGSLLAVRQAGFAGSEASDTTSNMSDDGLKSVPKKKKSVRVSFDEDPVAIGRAASPPIGLESPVIMSPQNKQKGRSWFDLVREKQQETAVSDADKEGGIQPMPTLPSFGSVRRDRDEGPALDSSKGQKQSQDWAQDTLRSIDNSSDHAVGSILAQEAASKSSENDNQSTQKPVFNEPLPPEVTSVEGSGYHSDEDTGIMNDQGKDKDLVVNQEAQPEKLMPESAEALPPSSEHAPGQGSNSAVPSISLQPATPGFDTAEQQQKEWLGMPGQFPEPPDRLSSAQSLPSSTIEHQSSQRTPATIGLAEPEPEAVAIHHDPASPNVGAVADGLRIQIESNSDGDSDDTGDSIYSDAAEDPDDLEGDGFGSINAIVESPAPSPILPGTSKSSPDSPSARFPAKATRPSPLARKESELSEPTSEEGWNRAQAYWSGLSQEKKRALEHAAIPGALDDRVIPNKTMRGPDSVKKKKKKVPKKPASPARSNDPPLPPWPDKQYRSEFTQSATGPAPPPKSSLRKSQDQQAHEPQMRSSMGTGPLPNSTLANGAQRNSAQLPKSEPRQPLQKKNRPTSAVAMVDYNSPQNKAGPGHVRASSAVTPSTSLTPVPAQPKKKTQVKKSMLQRNDSDSSSSFKKERPTASTSASGKYTMKRTMRPSSVDARGSADRMSSMSARTASPTGSTARRPFSTMGPGGGGMRMSMRDSMDSTRPAARTTLRESTDSKRSKSPSRFGFGKSSKPKATSSKPASRFSSRFGDSSDEEDSRPIRTSRFADSSDDEPTDLTPVRGIPRRIDEGDSTDLEDSSAEHLPNTGKPKANGVAPSLDTKPEGAALATGSLRVASGGAPTTALGNGLQAKKAAEKDKKKRSLFSSLGSKKKDDPSRVRKADIESPARRDTPLERSKTERLLTTGGPKDDRVLGPSSPQADPVAQAGRPGVGSRTSSAQNSPKPPKLQRRNTPKRLSSANDISWPLPQNSKESPSSRPQTSDGAAVSKGLGRPDIGDRRTTVQESIPPPTAPLAVGKTEKKKRFGKFRKALGMQS
ncbi:hypothetical protein ACLMJK_003110 [Lecanora helva]